MAKKNLFITFEGIEGSGKSTTLKLLADYLISKKITTFSTREPGGNNAKFSEEVRQLIMNNNQINALTELLLFESARSEHVRKVIEPALKTHQIVICDRFIDSTLVYQSLNNEIKIETIKYLNKIATNNLFPDLTFIFDINPKISLKRIAKPSLSRIENRFDLLDFEDHNKIRTKYKNLLKLSDIKAERFVLIDAEQSSEEIVKQIIKTILKYCEAKQINLEFINKF